MLGEGSTEEFRETIGVLGGTGPQGSGLAYRFAKAGYEVLIGSRSAHRAAETAAAIASRLVSEQSAVDQGDETIGSVRGLSNADVAARAATVLLAVPYEGHDQLVVELAPHLNGKIVVSCVNPLGFDSIGPYGLDVGSTSAAENAQRCLPDASVVGAFHHLAAASLSGPERHLQHEDVLVCGDDIVAKRRVMALAAAVTGKTGIDAGALRLARQLEPLTAVLISINKRYKVRSGLAVVGL